jgi:hypothetical protein
VIIGISGYAGSGKDTIAEYLCAKHGYKRIAFADAIRDFVYAINPIVKPGLKLQDCVDEMGWDKAKTRVAEVRRLLQEVGVSARLQFGDDFWVKIALRDVAYTSNVVITDVRFPNEAQTIKDRDYSQLWRIERPGVGPVNTHISETALDSWDSWDCKFINDGSLESLAIAVKTRMMQFV